MADYTAGVKTAPPQAPNSPPRTKTWEESESTSEKPPSKIGDTVIAIYDFDGENDDELSFKAGDKIKVLFFMNRL